MRLQTPPVAVRRTSTGRCAYTTKGSLPGCPPSPSPRRPVAATRPPWRDYGGGIDCFLASQQVGSEGHVTGLDMTDDMLTLARANQAKLGIDNVEFVKGEMENMPLPDASMDVVISNCVVCLSPDKDAVFQEAFRVLAAGGRVHISDMLSITEEGPARTDPEAWASCIAGAESRSVYLGRLERAGFVDIVLTEETVKCDEEGVPMNVASVKIVAHKPG